MWRDEPYQCECKVDYSEFGITGSPTQCHYHGSGVWQCPECGEIRDLSDMVYLLTLEYFKIGDDADFRPGDNLNVKAIVYDSRLEDNLDCIMDDIRESGGWAYEGIEGHELGIFETEMYWHWYRCSYEYEEYELDMEIITEKKVED